MSGATKRSESITALHLPLSIIPYNNHNNNQLYIFLGPTATMSTLNLDKCIEQLMRCEILSESTVKEICDKMKELLIYEPNVQSLKAPVTIVGNIHGYVIVTQMRYMHLQ